MITLLKTPLFALFLCVFMLPLAMVGTLVLPDALSLRDALAATPAMTALADLAEYLPGRRSQGPREVDPATLASLLIFVPGLLLTTFLVHRVSVWMVMPVGGGRGITLPTDLMRWLGGVFTTVTLLGVFLAAVGLFALDFSMTIPDHGVTLGALPADYALAPAWPMALGALVGGLVVFRGMRLSLRAAGITMAPGRSFRHAIIALALAAIAPFAVLLIATTLTAAGPARELISAELAWVTVGHVWAVAASVVIAFQVSFTVLSTRAHLARLVQRLARDDLMRMSSTEALAQADRSISLWRRERLQTGRVGGWNTATA